MYLSPISHALIWQTLNYVPVLCSKQAVFFKSLGIIKRSVAECLFLFHASHIATTTTTIKLHYLTLLPEGRRVIFSLWQATFILAVKFRKPQIHMFNSYMARTLLYKFSYL
jgi:hypothetical protein